MVKTIQHRMQSKDWDEHLHLINPEGMCGNGTCLAQFNKGAFIYGAPVQPCFIEYPELIDIWFSEESLSGSEDARKRRRRKRGSGAVGWTMSTHTHVENCNLIYIFGFGLTIISIGKIISMGKMF